MFKLQVKSKDDPNNTLNLFDSFVKDIKANELEIKTQLQEIGIETARKMVSIIEQNKKRPQNDEPLTLENHITVTNFEDGWGVGDIEDLNEHAGYWAAVNWGSSHMVGKRVPDGHFNPGQEAPSPDAFRQGRWVANLEDDGGMAGGNTGFTSNGRKHWSFIVSQPIPAMNYIEKTQAWLNIRMDAIVNPK